MGVSVREKIKGSGEYWIFIRHAGERTSQLAGSLEVAEDAAKDILRDIRTGRFSIDAMKAARAPEMAKEAIPAGPTLKEYFDRYEIEFLEKGVRKSTAVSYRGSFDNHIDAELGAVPLKDLTRAKVKAFVGSLTRKTYKRTIVEKVKNDAGEMIDTPKVIERPLSKSTIRIITAALCACLNHAREDELIVENPVNRLTKLYRQAKSMHEEIQPLSPAEVPLFLQSAQDIASEYYAMFLTLLHTGMRSGECAGLQWGDLDFNGKFVIVRRTITPDGRIEKTKTDRVRRIDMSDELLATLELHRKECLKKSLKEAKALPDWVFANKEGNPPDMHNIKNRVFHRVLERAKLRRIRMHDLRHSYASLMISAGVSPAYVQQQLGHASIKMTVDTYTHLIPGANRDATNVLPGLSTLPGKAAARG